MTFNQLMEHQVRALWMASLRMDHESIHKLVGHIKLQLFLEFRIQSLSHIYINLGKLNLKPSNQSETCDIRTNMSGLTISDNWYRVLQIYVKAFIYPPGGANPPTV